MKKRYLCKVMSLFILLLLVSAPLCIAEQGDSTIVPPGSKAPTVEDLYPGLTRGALAYAKVCELPKGTLFRTDKLVLRNKELTEDIAEASPQMQAQIRKNMLFHLEQIATFRLALAEATAETQKAGADLSNKTDQDIVQNYLKTLVNTIDVNEVEIRDFYQSNTQMFSGAALAQIAPQIKQFLLQQKQQEFVNEHIRTIGQRMKIEISASWLKKHAALATDNPVDKARYSGKPSLIDFGSVGCVPCDMMAPILDTLREQYKGKVNVVFVHVGEEPILASRYGVESIPVQIFFDEAGKEFFRHTGFFPQEEIEEQLSKMGVK